MHDFRCTEPDDMYYPALAKQTRYFKYDQEGVAVMCKAIEDMRNEAQTHRRQKSGQAAELHDNPAEYGHSCGHRSSGQ